MDLDRIQRFANDFFGISTKAKKLVGHVDLNYYLKTENNEEYILKIARFKEDRGYLEMQNQTMLHLEKKKTPLHLPQVLLNKKGESITVINDDEGHERYLRLLTWVPGKLWVYVNPHAENLLKNLGQVCGTLSGSLNDFDHPATHRDFKWDVSQAAWVVEYFHFIEDEEQRKLATYFFELFEKKALPKLPQLRKSICHNDINDYNILVSSDLDNPKISGVIDFGDLIYTNTINELAIAIAYAAMHKTDPLSAAAMVVKGFHEKYPLKEEELVVLFPLIAARLLITVTNSAIGKKENPENEYLQVSEKPAWDLLEKLRMISPDLVHFTFRNASGLEPFPKNTLFQNWFDSQKGKFAKIVNFDLSSDEVYAMDLSVGSLELGNNSDFDTPPKFNQKINSILDEADAKIGVGGYGEIRPFYTTDAYEIEGNNGPQWRTVHLGTDIWVAAGTPLFAPLEGKIHSFQNNEGDCNYGPTIVLEHKLSPELIFYTLYGHLNLESLDDLVVGMEIKKGQQIAVVGDISVNGNWPPHLHFQLMLDMLDCEGDFPGVVFPEQVEIWKSICPDPKILLGLDGSFLKEKVTKAEIFQKRKEHLGKNLSISYQKPLHMVRGYKQYLYDETGRRYLDTVNNVPHVGHQHPRVVKAAQKQLAVLNTNTRYLHENIIRYAEELLATFPDELSVCFFVNSGSEANELALRMTRNYSGQKDMVAVEVGYHGNTGSCIDISSYKFDGKGGKGAPSFTHIVPIPDTYRGLYRSDDKDAGKKYANHIQKAIEKVKGEGRNIAGFICESVMSCGGQIILPEGYLKEVYAFVRETGGLCIADEVQVGFGRVGKKFWGFELQNVVPDIVTLGKPIGNGHPLAAVVTTAKVAEAFTNGMEYFNTFGGNPVSCAIGRAVLQIVKDEKLQQHVLEVGSYLLEGFKELQQKHPIIGDIRGSGLFLGFELVENRSTLKPAGKQATQLANRMRDHGILMSTDGPFYNVLKIKPPMCFDKKNADFLLLTLNKILKEDYFTQF
jgi:4-aminobutyrate aminotransferase-like enzyme/Ser/Thr protein kinase RdoA (MazF antagonist)